MKKSLEEFLSDLGDLDIKLWVDGTRLRCSARNGTLTPTLRTQLAERKAEIQTFLQKANLTGHSSDRDPSLPTIIPNPDKRHHPFPLTDVQQAYWIGRSEVFELSNVATHSYTEIECVDLDLERFNKAWQRLIDRHDMLRAIVRLDAQQQILEQVPLYEIEVLDLRGQSPEVVASQLAEIRDRMSHEILAADQWPLFNIRATQLSDTCTRIHISFDALLSDAWSGRNVIIPELAAMMQNPEISLPPLELSFRDYVLAELAFRDSQTYRRSLEYWQSRLATIPPAPELPLEKHLAAVKHPRFVHLTGRLEPDTWQRLKTLATRVGVTPSGMLLAVFAEILTVWSKTPRFTINLTLFNRLPLHPEVNQVVGDFTSLTLLAVDNSGQDSFELRARRIQEQLWEDLDHRYFSGVQVLRELARIQKRPSGALMPVVFTSTLTNHQDTAKEQSSLENWLGKTVYRNIQTPQVYLDNGVTEEEGALVFNWNAVEELFPAGLLDNMFAAYCNFLERLANEEELWQATTRQLLPPAQVKQLEAINATDAPVADVEAQRTLHTLFFDQVPLQQQKAAVVTSDRTLTYQELCDLVLQLGHQLRQLDVRPNQLVAIVMEKGWEQVVAALGILASGAAYLPIDPGLPNERRWHLLEQGEVQFVITQSWLDTALAWPQNITRLCIDTWESPRPCDPLESVQQPSDVAYVIYTSGSTGLPKGVTIDHRGAVNTILDINQRFNVTSADRAIALSSLSFDLSVYDIFGILAAGGTIVIPDADAAKNPEHWAQLIVQHQVTIWNSVPPLMQMLVEYTASCRSLLPQSLRLVLLSGDWLPVSLPDQIRASFENVQVVSLGGATEASIWSILYPIEQVDPSWKSIPYGRPMTNQHVYVLDEVFNQRPVCVPGQLYIGGTGLAKGYWRNEEKTNASFIIHPQTKERLYKTGDLGRYLPDGNIEFLGREDFQVKVNGYRIELGEIEAALKQHPAVKEVVVTAVGESRENKQLVAYVVLEREQIGSNELRNFVQQKLPEYMVPSAYLFLNALPLTANGKVDRRALPAPESLRPQFKAADVMPQTEAERLTAAIWQELLGLERVSLHDSFFDLGGNSVLATQAISRLREAFQLEIPLRWLFESPTVAELSDRIQTAIIDTNDGNRAKIERIARNDNLPLSFAQQRLWFLDQLEPNNTTYNMSTAVRLMGAIDIAALEQSFNEIVRRHEVLRTTFIVADGQPVQVIAPTLTLNIPVVDLQALPETEQEAEVLRLAKQEAQLPFNLTNGSLLRVTLLKLSASEHILLFTIHHIICDGWSLGIFVREFTTLYDAFSQGKPSPLPELPIQYADFAHWQNHWLQGDVLENLLSYWQRQLAGAPSTLTLPMQQKRPAVQSFRGESQLFQLSAAATEQLQILSRQAGVTLFMTLLAAFQTLLYRYTHQDNIVVGTDVANRNRHETESLIGFFVNLLVMRTDLSGNPSFRELLERVREVALGAYAHQDLPFAKLVEALRPDRNSSHTPLFQVLFVLQNAPLPVLELSGLSVTPIEMNTGITRFDLALFMEETEQGIIGIWKYSTDLFEKSAIARLSHHFETLLSSLVKNPDTRIDNLEMQTKAEKQKQLDEQTQREKVNFNKFKSIKPKAVSLPQKQLIKTTFLQSEQSLPLVIEPDSDEIDLADWARSHRELIETNLLKHGAILFRGFNLNSAAEFEHVANAIHPNLFGEYGDLPREGVSGKVYGSTPYPPDKAILFHNESSHLHRWPLKIWFFCVQPAQQGGETPILDCRKIYQILNSKLREKFEEKQLMYVRNYTEGLDVSWQDFFHTNDKAEVENYCRQAGMKFEWLENNGLKTRKIRPAVAKHPKTGELVFFNQLQLHHVSCLDSAVRQSLLSVFGEDKLPRNVYYGDGTPIEDSVMEEIGAIYQENKISFSWQKGDILMLDNMLTSHSRNPYVGSRKIVVAMGELITNAAE